MKPVIISLISLFIFIPIMGQGILPTNHSLSFHIGDPTFISYTQRLKNIKGFHWNVGAGIMGLVQDPDYERKYVISGKNFYLGKGMIYVLNISLKHKLDIIENKFGLQFQVGIHNRIIHNLSIAYFRGPQYIPVKTKFEPQVLFQGGFFYSPSNSTVEIGCNGGVCIDQIERPGYTEFLWDIYMGVKF